MRRLAPVLAVLTIIAACGSDDDGPGTAEPAESAAPAVTVDVEGKVEAKLEAQIAVEGEVSEPEPATEVAAEQRWPDVVDATATFNGETWTVAATLSSPYDTPERYADSWRVLGPDGSVYGERFLTHDHQNEQPFTRSQNGITIPDDVTMVVIEGRDQQYGWGGTTFTLELDR